MSYDYDGSVSGLSEDDQAYDVPKNIFRKDKGRISGCNSRGSKFISFIYDLNKLGQALWLCDYLD